MRRTTLATAALAATLATAIVPATARADGQLVLDYTAQNADEATAIGLGLALYQIGNGADPAQVIGRCSNGVIHQDGNGHTGSLTQTGACQNYGLVQLGNGSTRHVVQNNDGEAGIGIVFGFD